MSLGELYNRWIDPIVDAVHERDEPQIEAAIKAAEEHIRSGQLDADDAQALEFLLAYSVFMIKVYLHKRDEFKEGYKHAIGILDQPSCGQLSSLAKRRYLLQLRIVGHNTNIQHISPEEVDALLADLPFEDRHSEQWHLITNYAFHQRDIKRVKEAYEEFLLHHAEWNKDFIWRRLETMYKLLDGRATLLDAELLVKSVQTMGNASEVEKAFWPHFEEAGLASDGLRRLLESRRARLK